MIASKLQHRSPASAARLVAFTRRTVPVRARRQPPAASRRPDALFLTLISPQTEGSIQFIRHRVAQHHCASHSITAHHTSPPSLSACPQALALSTADCPLPWVLRVFFSQRLHEFAAAAGHPAADSDADDADENADGDGDGEGDGDDETMASLPHLDTGPEWLSGVTVGLGRLGLWPVVEEAFTAAVAAALRRFLRAAASQKCACHSQLLHPTVLAARPALHRTGLTFICSSWLLFIQVSVMCQKPLRLRPNP